MQNSDPCYESFTKGLKMMSEYFSDTLSEGRIALYWQLLGPDISLEEWEYACRQAMLKETFHKVPLASHLMEYVREYRRAQREALLQEQCAEGVRTRKRLLELRDSLVDPAEVDALIASVWPDERPAIPKPIFPRPRLRSSLDDLHYEPTVDAETAQRKAREQLRQLMEQDHTREGDDAWPIERQG